MVFIPNPIKQSRATDKKRLCFEVIKSFKCFLNLEILRLLAFRRTQSIKLLE